MAITREGTRTLLGQPIENWKSYVESELTPPIAATGDILEILKAFNEAVKDLTDVPIDERIVAAQEQADGVHDTWKDKCYAIMNALALTYIEPEEAGNFEREFLLPQKDM